MVNELQVFSNEVFGDVRAISVDDKVMFVAFDVAEALGYKNKSRDVQRHCKNVKKHMVYQNGTSHNKARNTQEMLLINEYDVIRLIMKSKLPQAQEFERWVIEEVIPSVLTTGSYDIKQKQDSYMIDDPIKRAERWIEEQKEKQALELKIEEQKPDVDFAQAIKTSDTNLSIGTFAKHTKLGRNELFKLLRENNVLYYDNGNNVPYQQFINQSYFVVSQAVNNKHINIVTKITPKGQQWLFKRFPELKRED